jgi:hypothetical protein
VFDKAVWKASRCVQGALCGSIRRMSKGEASCAVGLGRDGRVVATLVWGEILATVPSGVRISR